METPNSIILEKIKSIFAKETKTKLEEVQTKDGVTIFAEVFDVGEAAFIVDGEERVPLPVGDYELEDGRMLVVEEEGIIASITEAEGGEKEPATEEEPASSEEDEMSKEKERIKNIMKEILTDLQKEEMQSFIDDMQKQVNEMKTDLSEKIDKVITELGEMPAGEAPKKKPKAKGIRPKLGSQGRNLTVQESIYARLYKNY